MSPVPADRPLRKVTLNLYEEDCAILEAHHGHGWTVHVRDLVNDHATLIRRSTPVTRQTLGDLNNG